MKQESAAEIIRTLPNRVGNSLSLRALSTKPAPSSVPTKASTKPPKAPKPIYYISTQEGLVSHLTQLGTLWNYAMAVNRPVIVIPFISHHYTDVENPISICDVFVFPSMITCEYNQSSLDDIIRRNQCVLMGKHSSWCTHPESYGLNKSVIPTSNFDYSTAECLAGMVREGQGKFPKIAEHKDLLPKLRFHLNYIKVFTMARNHLYHLRHINSSKNQQEKFTQQAKDEYVVAHWRRGDQAKRCAGKIEGQEDNSINCKSADEFAKEVIETMAQYKISMATHIVYVATNEENLGILGSLHKKGFKLLSDIRHVPSPLTITVNERNANRSIAAKNKNSNSNINSNGKSNGNSNAALQPHVFNNSQHQGLAPIHFNMSLILAAQKHREHLNTTLTSFDEFILEIIFMCDAKYYFAWGFSGVQALTKACRSSHKDKISVFDGKLWKP
jgi:hypothetical protein